MQHMDWLYDIGALIPSIGVGLIFWFAMRALLRADRHEREAEREAEKEYRLARESDQRDSARNALQ